MALKPLPASTAVPSSGPQAYGRLARPGLVERSWGDDLTAPTQPESSSLDSLERAVVFAVQEASRMKLRAVKAS